MSGTSKTPYFFLLPRIPTKAAATTSASGQPTICGIAESGEQEHPPGDHRPAGIQGQNQRQPCYCPCHSEAISKSSQGNRQRLGDHGIPIQQPFPASLQLPNAGCPLRLQPSNPAVLKHDPCQPMLSNGHPGQIKSEQSVACITSFQNESR